MWVAELIADLLVLLQRVLEEVILTNEFLVSGILVLELLLLLISSLGIGQILPEVRSILSSRIQIIEIIGMR